MQKVINDILTNYQIVHPQEKHTLLILHGWGQSSLNWQNTLDNLPPGITGIALDLPSFGGTQPLPNNPGVPEYSNFVKSFIDKQKLKNVTLLGHSFGGQIAVDFSLRFPKLISHLILVSPACIRKLHPGKKSQLAKAAKPLLKVLTPGLYDHIFKRIASENYLKSTPTQREILNKILYQDYSSKIKDISIPTSIIWGEKDGITTTKEAYKINEEIKVSKLEIIPGVGHSPHRKTPEFLAGKILENLT